MKIIEFLYNIKKRIIEFYEKYFTTKGVYTCILPDKIYIKKLYKERTGKTLNLKNPQTFNEKQNWLKLYDRRPEYTMMVDKYKVREYIKEKIGEEYLVPLLGVWDSPDDIDFDALPDEFVLKCNHDNGVIICRDKSKLDIEAVKKNLADRLKRDYYKKLREWPYKNVERKIICEKFMKNHTDKKPLEYKFFCYDGKPSLVLVISDRTSYKTTTIDAYDIEWNYLSLQNGHSPLSGNVFKKPECFEKMFEIAMQFADGLPFLRVDFNIWNDLIYLGELTLYDSGGFEQYSPNEWDYKLGLDLNLPKKYRR